MYAELDCEGKIVLGPLSPEIVKRLSDFSGNWLEYSTTRQALVVRHVQPTGLPALTGVPGELIALLSALPNEMRSKISNGELFLKSHHGRVLRLTVEQGQVRIQWPQPDFNQLSAIPSNEAFASINAHEAKINGWVKFSGTEKSANQIQNALDRFEGLYPEGTMLQSFRSGLVHLEFKDVNIGPQELMKQLHEVSSPASTLEAQLDVSLFVADSAEHDFRIVVQKGDVKTYRPALWK